MGEVPGSGLALGGLPLFVWFSCLVYRSLEVKFVVYNSLGSRMAGAADELNWIVCLSGRLNFVVELSLVRMVDCLPSHPDTAPHPH